MADGDKAGTLTDADKAWIGDAIAAAVTKAGEGKGAPKGDEGKGGTPAPSEDEWASMGPRQRESWVHQAVTEKLEQLRRDDKLESMQEEIDRLKAGGGATGAGGEGEKAPSVVTWLTRFFWGEPAEGEQ